ncbi:hypothetical protein [Actinoplanes siamensis]|uniref:Ig-like domain-containing protein n=1 Tax=Actinoplanes siamensis TaxID=1223317 RepID=A0A919N9B1_9ACTN|nr:hypothetical protein [Actinoplanes siamensis]GIF06620.1 hypothetical protein Asi03nite_41580 [Actinoplanes siamensis]
MNDRTLNTLLAVPTALAAGVLPPTGGVTVAPETGFDIVATVSTGPSSADGVRDCRTSPEPATAQAPDGLAIDRQTVKVEWLNARGSDNGYHITYDDHVAVTDGVRDERRVMRIAVTTHACSFKGVRGNSGRSTVRVTGTYVPAP